MSISNINIVLGNIYLAKDKKQFRRSLRDYLSKNPEHSGDFINMDKQELDLFYVDFIPSNYPCVVIFTSRYLSNKVEVPPYYDPSQELL